MQVILEFLAFLRYRRRYWLWPLFILFIIIGLIVVAAQSTVLGPLLYTLF
ncbi:hypothetical protein SAMN05216464_101484 [Mucilaginibacter pineti]|uniref:Uncharacterized protein n=1 Tax=Mucilaginibacter pineti TaxID=1391627 RepID=A0A1G6U077_9SPHI|nr:hypothetical protein SAMN05216464_101484 [Mucilaginibacter pineti]